ncbi:hypothetical protein DXG03_009372 [Asterophora parasitica]|uniref:Leucine rich repeat domain protein n=1 Tax=Asterophora parasitica TaxID=117018 RepID=A0A9P7GI48_9AGAR|nr:hypothetical protein DXG03_009372 [Asterophora parasitica]
MGKVVGTLERAYSSSSSFSTSPPSSPGTYLDSSSPPSSPSYESAFPVDDGIPQISDPYAASRSSWHPPLYERKRSASPHTPPSTVKKPRLRQPHHLPSPQSSPTTSSFAKPASFIGTRQQTEEEIWDEASSRVVDEGHGAVTLDNKQLTHIPESFIHDLTNFSVLSEKSELANSSSRSFQPPSNGRLLSRVATAPATSFETTPRVFQRTRSAVAPAFGLPREKLQLFLSSNMISSLPVSLLCLENLRVLSLRNNNILVIPPEIIGLKNLEDLNIAQNQISYLPAEMLQMSLLRLQVNPNPFISREILPGRSFKRSSTSQSIRLAPTSRRLVSTTTPLLPRIPPLVELLYRVLLSPLHHAPNETVLEHHYSLPLSENSEPGTRQSNDIPSHIRTVLHHCLPGSVYLEEADTTGSGSSHLVTRIDQCPSPRHQQQGTPRVFVRHAEERFTWEKTIANVDVGGLVPVRWRGCELGCLDFLNPLEESTQPDTPGIDIIDAGYDTVVAASGQEMDDVVQVVNFGAGADGMDQFGEEL